LKRHILFVSLIVLLGGVAEAMAQGTGTIRGHIGLSGKLPGNPVIRMGMDPKCNKMNAGKRVIQEYVVATIDGSLANAFVRLKGNFPQTPVPTQPVTVDQRGCVYVPRVVGARVGQTVQVKNSDDLLHNVDALSGQKNGFNIGQPRAGMVYEFKPKSEEVMLIGIVSHPYFAVSTTKGTFEIDKVPAGTYMIEAWHERLGIVSKSVTVKPGAVATVDFTYASKEK
jgi:plastocyanin